MKEQVKLKRTLGLWSSLAMVIGTVIGSGIFFKQASVLDYSHSTTMALLAWLFGGLLTLASGLTIARSVHRCRILADFMFTWKKSTVNYGASFLVGCRSLSTDRL